MQVHVSVQQIPSVSWERRRIRLAKLQARVGMEGSHQGTAARALFPGQDADVAKLPGGGSGDEFVGPTRDAPGEALQAQAQGGDDVAQGQPLGAASQSAVGPTSLAGSSPAISHRWHKYGQKVSVRKGIVRSYYKCAMAKTLGCKAQKRVDIPLEITASRSQRVEAYIGEHNHNHDTNEGEQGRGGDAVVGSTPPSFGEVSPESPADNLDSMLIDSPFADLAMEGIGPGVIPSAPESTRGPETIIEPKTPSSSDESKEGIDDVRDAGDPMAEQTEQGAAEAEGWGEGQDEQQQRQPSDSQQLGPMQASSSEHVVIPYNASPTSDFISPSLRGVTLKDIYESRRLWRPPHSS